jgi:diguanylate cyclase (GGDEF)-like protein
MSDQFTLSQLFANDDEESQAEIVNRFSTPAIEPSPPLAEQTPQVPVQTAPVEMPPGAMKLSEAPEMAPVETGAVEMPKGATRLGAPTPEAAPDALAAMRELIERTDDPRGETARLATSLYLREMYGIDPKVTLSNYESIAHEIFGRELDPQSFLTELRQQWDIGWMTVERGLLYSEVMNGNNSQAIIDRLAEIENTIGSTEEIYNSIPAVMLKRAANLLPFMIDVFRAGAQEGMVWASAGATAAIFGGQIPPFTVMPEEGITVPASLVLSFKAGRILGGFRHAMQVEQGNAFADYLVDPRLADVPVELKAAMARSYGVVSSIIENVQVANIPGVRQLIQGLTSNAIKRVAVSGAPGRILREAAKAYLGNLASNIGEELMQEGAQMFFREIMVSLEEAKQGNEYAVPWAEIQADLEQTFINSLAGMAVIGIPGTVTGAISDVRASQRTGTITPAAQAADLALSRDTDVFPTQPPQAFTERMEAIVEQAKTDPQAAVREAMALVDEVEQAETQRAPTQTVEPWQMTREEWRTTQPAAELPAPTSEAVRQTIRQAMPQLTDQEVDGAALILDFRAEALGINTDEYVARTFQPGMFTQATELTAEQPNIRGAVQFADDGRAIIGLTERSDFSTWVHELGHIFQRQLTTEQAKIAERFYGVQNGWTVQQQEQFATDFENYLQDGKAPSEELRTVFQRFADWLTKIYDTLRGQVSPDIQQVFDSLLTKPDSGVALTQTETVRKLISEMTVEEKDAALLLNDATGIPNRRAYWEDTQRFGGPLPIQVSIDADSLKWVNDNIGHEAGTALLRRIAQALDEVTDRENTFGYHVSGDEFIMQGHDINAVLDALNALEDSLAGVTLDVEVNGRTANFGVGVSFGIDETGNLELADERLTRAKSIRGAEGARAERGEIPSSVRVRDAGGVELDRDTSRAFFDQRRAEIEAQRAASGVADDESGYRSVERRRAERRAVARDEGDRRETLFQTGIPIRQSPDDAYEVAAATFDAPVVLGNRMAPIDILTGGVQMDQPAERQRVARLAEQMRGEGGYVDRLIVDTEGNVVEGQHRLEALRQIGETSIPVTVIGDAFRQYDIEPVLDAIREAKTMRAEQARELALNAIEDIAEAGSADAVLATMELPAGYEGAYRAAYQALEQNRRPVEDVLFQPGIEDAHERSVREAVESGKFVPDKVLAEYADQQWVQDELATRKELRAEAAEAIKLDQPVDDFVQMSVAMALEAKDPDYYRQIYHTADGAQMVQTPQEIADAWVTGLSRESMTAYLREIAYLRVADQVSDRIIGNIAKHIGTTGTLTEAQYKKVMDKVRFDPVAWHQELSGLVQDVDSLRQMEQSLMEHQEVGELLQRKRELQAVRQQYKESMDTIENLRHRLELDQKYEADLKGLISSLESENMQQATAHAVAMKQAAAEAKKLGREIRDLTVEVGKLARSTEKGKAYQDALKSAVQEARLQARRVGQDIRAHIDARQRLEAMIKYIMRRPSTTMDIVQAKQIAEIQRGLDTRSHRRGRFAEVFNTLREQVGDSAELQAAVDAQIGKRSLRDMDIGALIEIHDQIADLRREGRIAYQQKMADQRADTMATVQQAIAELGTSTEVENIGQAFREAHKSGLATKLWFELVNMKRITERMGPTWQQMFDVELNRFTDDKLRHKFERVEQWQRMRTEILGTDSNRELFKKVTENYTVEEAVGIYIAMQNEDSAKALLGGNKISDAELKKIETFLRDNQKYRQLGDALMRLFKGESFDRLQEAVRENTNTEMQQVENYFPMRRSQVAQATYDAEVTYDLASRSSAGRTYAWQGFRHSRQTIALEHQSPIRLDAVHVALQAIEQQEHYSALQSHIRKLHRVMNDRDMQAAFSARFGTDAYQAMKEYINRVANPTSSAVLGGMEKALAKARQNLTLGALSFNLMSPLITISSLPFYMQHAARGNAKSFALALPRLMLSVMSLPFKFAEMRDVVFAFDPQARQRVIDPTLAEIPASEKPGLRGAMGRLAQAGMKPLRWVDSLITIAGEYTVYQAEMDYSGDGTKAAFAAQDATLRTQPFGGAKDSPAAYRSNMFKALAMFSTPLNQIFGMITADLPQSVARGKIGRALLTVFGIAASGVFVAMLRGKRLPNPDDEPEEFWLDVSSQFLEAIPILGPEVMGALRGSPFVGRGFSVTRAVTTTTQAVKTLFNDQATEKQQRDAIMRVVGAGMQTVGYPGIAAQRLYRTLVADETDAPVDLWQLLGGGPEE